MTFQPGQSGNPMGRHLGFEKVIRELRREIQTKSGGPAWFAKKLIEFVEHAPEHKDKLTAIKLLLEYGFGKPVQNVQIDGAEGGGVQIVVNTGIPQPEKLVPVAVRIVDGEGKPLEQSVLPAPIEAKSA